MADHQHSRHHGHQHTGHGHAPASFGMAFAVGTGLNLVLVVAELGFGYIANSLALISDGLHNFSDVLGLLLAWGAAWLSKRQPTRSRTYGYRRASIFAALGNAALLFVATGAILIEAVQRLRSVQPVAGDTVIVVAALGVVVNTATALMFMRGRERDLNIGGTFVHMAGDAGVSLGVVVTALLIRWTGLLWLDPIVSMAIAGAILWSCWSLMRNALNLALDAVPAGIDRAAVESYLAGLPGVSEVHDLHIWAMSTTETALTVHLVRVQMDRNDDLLQEAAHHLEHRFGIAHATLQIETGAYDCRLAPAHVV